MTMGTLFWTHISIFLGNAPACLRISNLPSYFTRDELKDLCSAHGTFGRFNYKSGDYGAFVHYNQRDDAQKAKLSLDLFPLGENILSVDLIEDKEDGSVSGLKFDNI